MLRTVPRQFRQASFRKEVNAVLGNDITTLSRVFAPSNPYPLLQLEMTSSSVRGADLFRLKQCHT